MLLERRPSGKEIPEMRATGESGSAGFEKKTRGHLRGVRAGKWGMGNYGIFINWQAGHFLAGEAAGSLLSGS